MSKSLFLILISICLGFASCNSYESDIDGSYAAETSYDDMSMAEAPPVEESTTTVKDFDRKLIKDGNIRFETDDVDATHLVILNAIREYNGYVASEDAFNSPSSISNIITARIPSDSFDEFIAKATTNVEHLDSKRINVQDVTEEFLDVEARLKTKKELEQRFIDLLQRANDVTEILSIENEIGNLRSEIESIEGRLKYLKSQVNYSTITFEFYETVPTQTKFGNKFTEGFVNGWNNLVWFIVGLINVWPFLLLIPIIVFGLRWLRRRMKSRK